MSPIHRCGYRILRDAGIVVMERSPHDGGQNAALCGTAATHYALYMIGPQNQIETCIQKCIWPIFCDNWFIAASIFSVTIGRQFLNMLPSPCIYRCIGGRFPISRLKCLSSLRYHSAPPAAYFAECERRNTLACLAASRSFLQAGIISMMLSAAAPPVQIFLLGNKNHFACLSSAAQYVLGQQFL